MRICIREYAIRYKEVDYCILNVNYGELMLRYIYIYSRLYKLIISVKKRKERRRKHDRIS